VGLSIVSDNFVPLLDRISRDSDLSKIRDSAHAIWRACTDGEQVKNGTESVKGYKTSLYEQRLFTCANTTCDNTESLEKKFLECAGCKLMKYCSTECQKKHWRNGHREMFSHKR